MGLESEQVRGDVVDDLQPVRIHLWAGLDRRKSRRQCIGRPFDETETDISERSGKVEISVGTVFVVARFDDVGAESAVPLGEHAPGRVDVAHPKANPANAVRMTLQPTIGRRAAISWSHAHALRLAGGKYRGIFAAGRGLPLIESRHFRHIHHFGVEAFAPFHVTNDELKGVVSNDTETGTLVLLFRHFDLRGILGE